MHNLFKPKQALLALAMVLTATLTYGQTQSGALDPSFGLGGTVTNDFGAESHYCQTGRFSRLVPPAQLTASTSRYLDLTAMAHWIPPLVQAGE
jgi:hypothetical protein